MKARNYNEAWEIVRALTEGVTLDEKSSERAGYKIYRSADEYYTYVCDLGDRLEVNLANGKTLNIWIENEAEKNPGAVPENEIENIYTLTVTESQMAYIRRACSIENLKNTCRMIEAEADYIKECYQEIHAIGKSIVEMIDKKRSVKQ